MASQSVPEGPWSLANDGRTVEGGGRKSPLLSAPRTTDCTPGGAAETLESLESLK